jgi:hypothetical protein
MYSKRNVSISRAASFAVPRPETDLPCVIAYSGEVTQADGVSGKCEEARCRHHDDSFELFSSSVRDENTKHGIPVLFFQDFAIVCSLQLPEDGLKNGAMTEYTWNGPFEVVDYTKSQ